MAPTTGHLWSTMPVLYGANHLFSILQPAATDTTTSQPLHHMVLHDRLRLAHTIHDNPAPLHTLVPYQPTVLVSTDVSHLGIGGAWCDISAPSPQHYWWHAPLDLAVKLALVSLANPTGPLSINDLELAAIIVGGIHPCTTATSPPD